MPTRRKALHLTDRRMDDYSATKINWGDKMKWLISWIRKLPIARFIKPLWKGALKQAVQIAGDSLQEATKKEIQKDLTAAAPKVAQLLSDFQTKAYRMTWQLPIPDQAKAQCLAILKDSATGLEKNISTAIEAKNVKSVNMAIDSAFDAFQALVIVRIDAL